MSTRLYQTHLCAEGARETACFAVSAVESALYASGGTSWCSTQQPAASPLSTRRPRKCARSTVMSALCTVYSCEGVAEIEVARSCN